MSEFIDEIINSLSDEMRDNEAFLSEGDFQYSFAKMAESHGATKVVLERPYNLDGENARKHVDISFEYNDVKYFVELKYKTKQMDGLRRYGEDIYLTNQWAQNDAMYYFRSDINKMERFLRNNNNYVAFCIFITNDPAFWRAHNRDQNARVSLENGERINAGILDYSDKPNLDMHHDYRINWQDFNEAGSFRYLIIQPQA